MSEVFEQVISYENLYRAHRRARLGKRHKREVIEFELNLSENLWKLHYDLKYGRYECGGYRNFKIYDPKERVIEAIGYRDRIVQHSLCDNYLTPLVETRLTDTVCACRKGKGNSFAVATLKRYIAEHYKRYGRSGHFVKLDIHKYFDCIDHAILKGKLKRLHIPSDMLGLIFGIIDSYAGDKGLPKGNQTSQIFANLYLDGVDRFIKEDLGVRRYLRYMDDMLILSETKEVAKAWLGEVKRSVEEEKIALNPKSGVVALKNGVNFLGWRFFLEERGKIVQKVKKDVKRRIIRKAKIKRQSKDFEKIKASLVSYRGFLRRADGHGFLAVVRNLYYART